MTNFNCENAAALITGAAAVLGFVVREQVASSWTAALRRTDLNMRALRMRLLSSLAAAMLLTATIPAVAEQQARADDVQILRNGSRPSRTGDSTNFVGSVRLDPLFPARMPSRMSGGSVTFEPGARSNWHTHPVGQVLIVTAGLGWVQQAGGEIQEMRPGDVVLIAPNVRHWHGASPTTSVTHIALQEQLDGSGVNWMEPVSDAQYRR